MKKCLITLFILAWPISAWAIEEREGYCKLVTITSNSQDVFTVPEGKRFVLLQLNCTFTNFKIQVDGNDIILGQQVIIENSYYDKFSHDFPDRCVTVNSGETLTVMTGQTGWYLNIIGYFYDYKRVSRPVADLTNDHRMDFSGLAVLASEWLKDGNINSGA